MIAILRDLFGYEFKDCPRYAIEEPWLEQRKWPPLLTLDDHAFVRTPRFLGWKRGDPIPPDGLTHRIYHEVRAVKIPRRAQTSHETRRWPPLP